MNATVTATDVTIRLARPQDERAVADLAVIDSSERLRGDVLVAEVDGALWAALSLEDARAVADPFRPSGDLVPLLRERAEQLRAPRTPVVRHGWVRFSARSFTGEP